MEIKTVIHEEIPESLMTDLEEDWKFTEQLLGVEKYDFEIGEDISDEFIDEKSENFGKISNELSGKITDFSEGVFGLGVHITEFRDVEKLRSIQSLLDEQLEYIHNIQFGKELFPPLQDCKRYFIVSYINNRLYGGIFLFWNEKNSDIAFIQGISKSLVPYLISAVYPEYNSMVPKLNSLLGPNVQMIAKRLGVKTIYVVPLSNQGKILEKFYGYSKSDKVVYPCSDIRGSLRVYDPNIRQGYKKDM